MYFIIFIVIALAFFIGFVFAFLASFLYTIGLGFISRFLIKGIFYTQDTVYKEDIIWNKPVVRFTLVFSVLITISMILHGISNVKLENNIFQMFIFYPIFSYLLWCISITLYQKKQKVKTINSIIKIEDSFVFKTNEGEIQVSNPSRGIFICGGAGSGKTASIINPIIQQAGKQNYTGIVYDFKFPTLAKEVAGSYKNSDITQYYLNFSDLERTHRVNPIAPEYIQNTSYARDAARALLYNLDFKAASNRDFWIQSSEALLTGVIWFLRSNYPQFCTLPHVIGLILRPDTKKLLELLNQDLQTSVLIASITSSVENEKQFTGIISNIQNYLSQIATPEIFWILSENEINLDLNNPNNRGILTIGNTPSISSVLSPIIGLVITASLKMLNQPSKEKSILILDEAPTLFIPNFSQIPATARENKVSTIYCVQDIAQMQGMMNERETEMIISNLGSQFYGRTTNVNTAERVSKIFGKQDVKFTSDSRGVSFSEETTHNFGQSTSIQQRDKIMPSEVINMTTGEFCGIIAEGNKRIFKEHFTRGTTLSQNIPNIRNFNNQIVNENYNIINQEMSLLNP